jgi:hypothetical protein
MRTNRVSIILTTILTGCLNNPDPNPTFSLSFPLQTGTQWNYESVLSYNDSVVESYQLTTTISSEFTGSSGFQVIEFKDSIFNADWYDYYEKRPDGLYLYASTPGGMHALAKPASIRPEAVLRIPPTLWIPFTFQNNSQWAYDSIPIASNQSTIMLTRKFMGQQKITVTAGKFDCFVFETVDYAGGKQVHYFASGVGLVMKVATDSLQIIALGSPPGGGTVVKNVKSVRRNSLVSYK